MERLFLSTRVQIEEDEINVPIILSVFRDKSCVDLFVPVLGLLYPFNKARVVKKNQRVSKCILNSYITLFIQILLMGLSVLPRKTLHELYQFYCINDSGGVIIKLRECFLSRGSPESAMCSKPPPQSIEV